MNKTELIEAIAAEAELSKKDAEVFQTHQEAEDFLNKVFETKGVKEGCKVEIRKG